MPTWSPTFFAQLMAPFIGASTGWAAILMPFALAFYGMGSTLTLAWIIGAGVMSRDLHGMMSDLGVALVTIGVGLVVLVNAVTIGGAFYTSIIQIAGVTGALPAAAISPDGLMALGLTLSTTIFDAVGFGTWLMHAPTATILSLIGIAIFLFYIFMAVKLAWLIIQAFIAVTTAPLIIGFSGLRWLGSLMTAWLAWIVGISLELFFMYLILSIGLNLVALWVAELAAESGTIVLSINTSLIALGQTIVLFFLADLMPAVIRGALFGHSGAGFLGFAGAARAAVAGAVAGGAAAAAGGVALGQAGSTHNAVLLSSSQQSFQNMMSKT